MKRTSWSLRCFECCRMIKSCSGTSVVERPTGGWHPDSPPLSRETREDFVSNENRRSQVSTDNWKTGSTTWNLEDGRRNHIPYPVPTTPHPSVSRFLSPRIRRVPESLYHFPSLTLRPDTRDFTLMISPFLKIKNMYTQFIRYDVRYQRLVVETVSYNKDHSL